MVTVLIDGENLITDNGDVIKRCSNILQKAYLDVVTKKEIIKILNDPKKLYAKNCKEFQFICANSPEHQALIEAIFEQLSFVE